MGQLVKKSGLFVMGMLFIMISSCNKDSGTEPEKNKPPEVVHLSVNKSSLDYGDTAILTARAADPDGDILHFSWKSSGGKLTLGKISKTDTVQNLMTWKAPDTSGTYICTVSVTDSVNDPVMESISLTVSAHPVLDLNTNRLEFGNDSDSLNFIITNQGTGELKWTISLEPAAALDWLSYSPVKGTTNSTAYSYITVIAKRSNLSGGSYQAWIKVTSENNGLDSVLVLLKQPQLSVSPTSLNFGSEASLLTFMIQNPGSGELQWTIDDTGLPVWITSVSPTSGSTSTENDQITVSVIRDEINSGSYNTQIPVNSQIGGSDMVNVMMTVKDPELSVTPSNLDFGTDDTEKTLKITNVGGGQLKWQCSESVTWITAINPDTGSTYAETVQITVTVDRTGLSQGIHTGEIQIEAIGKGGQKSVNVSIEVVGPQLSLSPISLDFGQSTTTMSFDITNSNVGILNWSIQDGGSASWITSVSPLSGTTTSENDQVSIAIDRTGLAAGIYTDQIQVTSDGGNGSVDIQMEVVENPPVLSISPISLDFGTSLAMLSFNISNTGSGTLNWSIDNSGFQTWITSVSPLNGMTTTEADLVTVMVSRTGLAIGDYTAQIPVNSDGGNNQVDVSLSIPSPPPTCTYYDDFSGPLSSDWTTSYATGYTSGGYLYIDGNSSDYFGTIYHEFLTYMGIPWTYSSEVGYTSGTPISDDYYGLYIQISDTGYPSMPYLWFTIWPNSSGDNWLILAFLSAGTNSGWYLLASDSKGNSPLISTAKDGLNEIVFSMESNEQVVVKIGSSSLYTTDEIKTLEGVMGDIETDLVRVGIRTVYGLGVKCNYICVNESGSGTFLKPGESSDTTDILQEKELQEIMKQLPVDISKLRTVKEVLKVMHK